jgi:predicted XRE-type DNA-binding protein
MSPFSKVEMSPFVVLKLNFSTKGTEQVEPLLRMSQPVLTRLEVIQRVKRKTLKQRQAAELLSVSVRQVKRLYKAYQASGAATWPNMKVERRQYRFRIVNGSNARFYNLKLSNGMSFTQSAATAVICLHPQR